MTAKEYLLQIRLYESRIQRQTDEIGHLRDMMTRVSPVLKDDAGSGGGGFHDKISGPMARMIDMQAEMQGSIDELRQLKKKAMGILMRLNRPEHIDVLYMRYWEGTTWEEIADKMHYSYRGVTNLHGGALIEYAKEMEKDEAHQGGAGDEGAEGKA